MNLSPQPSLPEEPEQQPALSSSEETSTQPSTVSDSHFQETEYPSEDIPMLPASSSEPQIEETEQQPISASEPDEIEHSSLDENAVVGEDEDSEADREVSSSQPSRSGVFISRGVLIAAAGVIVVAALLIALLVVVNRPKDPPTDWIASYTPPAGSGSTTGKILYYLHWTNQNGELKGQLQLAAKANGSLQSLTAPATGLYNRDNHIIYVVVTVNGQADTLTGKINDTNDTLTLNSPGATSQSSQFVFHTGNANDYKQATKRLV